MKYIFIFGLLSIAGMLGYLWWSNSKAIANNTANNINPQLSAAVNRSVTVTSRASSGTAGRG